MNEKKISSIRHSILFSFEGFSLASLITKTYTKRKQQWSDCMNYTGYLRQPHYYETDQMGIIHHSNYIRWFEEARVDWLTFLDVPYYKIEEAGIIIPVLAVTCDYKEMIRYEDQVRIEVTIDHYTGTRLEFSYHIYNQTTENLLTTGTSKHCFLDKETNRLLQLRRSHPEIHRIFSETFERQKETTND